MAGEAGNPLASPAVYLSLQREGSLLLVVFSAFYRIIGTNETKGECNIEITSNMFQSVTYHSGDAKVEDGHLKGAIEYKAEHGTVVFFLSVKMTDGFDLDPEVSGEIESVKFMQGEDDPWTVVFGIKDEKTHFTAGISSGEMNKLLELNQIKLERS